MAKKSYIGIGGKARKIKKWYFGVDSKARKVKKGYIGVGGVARPFMSSELTYYGLATNSLSTGAQCRCASVGNYALVKEGSTSSTLVETYNTSLVKSSATSMTLAASSQFGVSTGSNAVFIGGSYYPSGSTTTSNMTTYYAYNSSLVMSSYTVPDTSSYSIDGATTINGHLIYGRRSTSTMKCLDSSFVSVSISGAQSTSGGRCMTHSSTHALVTGGATTLTTGYAYSTTLVRSSFTLQTALAGHMGTPLGTGAIVGFGDYSGSETTDHICDFISDSLVVSVVGTYSTSPYHSNGVCGTLEDFALFAGDYTLSSGIYDTSLVDVFDTKLVHSTMNLSKTNIYNAGCTTVGSYLLIAGGFQRTSSSATALKTVEVFTV